MHKISEKNMKEVKGGAVNWGLAAGIGAVLSFIIGVVDGLVNPKKCNG